MAAELLELFTPYLENLTLIPSGGGRFEIRVGEDLIYSKKTLGRHAQPGEVVRLLQEKTGFPPMPRE